MDRSIVILRILLFVVGDPAHVARTKPKICISDFGRRNVPNVASMTPESETDD